MDPLTMAAILGGTGLLKSIGPDKWKEDRQRKLAADTQRYSPWTGLAANEIKEADPFGSTVQGALSGFSMGQNMQAADAAKGLSAGTSGYSGGMAPGPTSIAMDAQEEELNPYMRSRKNFLKY